MLCGPAKANKGTRAAAAAARKAVQLLASMQSSETQASGTQGEEGSDADGKQEARDQALLLVLQFAAPVRRALKVCVCVCAAPVQRQMNE